MMGGNDDAVASTVVSAEYHWVVWGWCSTLAAHCVAWPVFLFSSEALAAGNSLAYLVLIPCMLAILSSAWAIAQTLAWRRFPLRCMTLSELPRPLARVRLDGRCGLPLASLQAAPIEVRAVLRTGSGLASRVLWTQERVAHVYEGSGSMSRLQFDIDFNDSIGVVNRGTLSLSLTLRYRIDGCLLQRSFALPVTALKSDLPIMSPAT